MQILPSKLMKVGIFLELDTLDSYPMHFGIIECLVTSLYQALLLSLYIVRGFALLGSFRLHYEY